MTPSVCILDYGSGNVASVFNLISLLCPNVIISNDSSQIQKSTHLILPGVGAFGASMEKIHKAIPLATVENEVLIKNKPFLGICVGMQVLADYGYEFGKHKGLGWIHGKVKLLSNGQFPLPHVGWNEINIKQPHQLLGDNLDHTDFYFVHSYAFYPSEESKIIATTEYSEEFCSVIVQDNIYGVQFHPEKSQEAGKILLSNFLTV